LPQIASNVFSALEIRTGGLVHAIWNSIPGDSVLTVPLLTPVLLTPGEQRDLPLSVSIANNASATGFQVHLEGSSAIDAVDANSGQPVTLVANLPWSTQSANILSPATTIEILTADTLPPGINQGQKNVPSGSLTFVLPGAPGQSEARITELLLSFADNGQALLAEDIVSRVRVRDGSTTLLDLLDIQSNAQGLPLRLSIPKVVASGDSVRLDLSFDLLHGVNTTQVEVVVADASSIVVRDANSGAPVSVTRAGGLAFPWNQGPATIQSAAQLLDIATVATAPTGTFPGAAQMRILDLTFVNRDPPGTADMLLQSLAFEILDEIGNPQVTNAAITAARWHTGGVLVAETTVAAGLQVVLTPGVPIVLAPGDTARVALQVDLSAALAEPWIRFHLPSNAITARDVNDASQAITILGMPASTALIQVVAEAGVVGLGVLDDPPTNVVPGTTGVSLLPIRIAHPGAANEADIQPQSLVVGLRDAQSQPLMTTSIAMASYVVWDSLVLVASAQNDSLVFDLSALPPLAASTALELQMHMDLATTIAVTDFRLAMLGNALRATSGSSLALTVQPIGNHGLPYESPTVHITAGTLEASFASYPNPFTPAQGRCNITFFLPGDSRVTCDVYTVSGDRVTRLLNGIALGGGLHDNLSWDGRNERGEVVRNGTYLLRIQADGPGGGEFYRKLAVVR
jgi:hypothetical protein